MSIGSACEALKEKIIFPYKKKQVLQQFGIQNVWSYWRLQIMHD